MAPPDSVPEIYRAPAVPPPPIGDVIREAYRREPSSVRQKDNRGMTPLHVAAEAKNPAALEALLGLPEDAGVWEDMSWYENEAGSSPMEMLSNELFQLFQLMEPSPPHDPMVLDDLRDAQRCVEVFRGGIASRL